MSAHTDLYTAETVRAFDRAAIAAGMPGFTLMRRAGGSCLRVLNKYYPEATSLHIYCGIGNNAGDGYVLARLAKQQGLDVVVIGLGDPEDCRGDAATARDQWLEVGAIEPWSGEIVGSPDVIIDALLGIGLDRPLQEAWLDCVQMINSASAAVIAVDIPTGLNANTGCVMGAAVRADHTVTFIALKQGLFTADAIEYRGRLHFDTLSVPDTTFDAGGATASLLSLDRLPLPRRPNNSHKTDFGRVLIVGGNRGMAGAVALAAKAALVAGAGLVRVMTRPEHVAIVTSLCPEAMVIGSAEGEITESAIEDVSQMLIGCGLGQDAWAQRCLYRVRALSVPVVYDADALNLVAHNESTIENAVAITPHPGEAARLLRISSAEIQADRYNSARRLAHTFACCAVLKGSGSLIASDDVIDVCDAGTAAMASAGMGDVLAGIITAFIAQGMSPHEACCHAVVRHAAAARLAAGGRSRGILASTVIDHLAQTLYET